MWEGGARSVRASTPSRCGQEGVGAKWREQAWRSDTGDLTPNGPWVGGHEAVHSC